jgi:hypothetical protein
MIKQSIIISIVAIFITIIANVGGLRCQENSNMTAEQNHSKIMGDISNKIKEDNVMDDRNRVVEILGKIIQHNLLNEYQKMDSRELEDRLERSR